MIYRRGNVWWYEFAFQGQRIRESAQDLEQGHRERG